MGVRKDRDGVGQIGGGQNGLRIAFVIDERDKPAMGYMSSLLGNVGGGQISQPVVVGPGLRSFKFGEPDYAMRSGY